MLTLSNIITLNYDYLSIHYEDRLNNTMTTTNTFHFDFKNLAEYKNNVIVFKKKYLDQILFYLMTKQFKVSNQFIQSLYNLTELKQSFLLFKSINHKLKTDLIELPFKNYLPKAIKEQIKNELKRFNLPGLVSDLFYEWILDKIRPRCFIKYLLFVNSLTNQSTKIHLNTILKLFDINSLPARKIFSFPINNITYITRSGMIIKSNCLTLQEDSTSQNESSRIYIPYILRKSSISAMSQFETKYCSKFYYNQLPIDYFYYTEHNYLTAIHNIGRFNNSELINCLRKYKNMNPTTEILMNFPDKVYKCQYWKPHMYTWNYRFIEFNFKVYDDILYNKETQSHLREKLILNRIQNNFKKIFYSIFECDNFGIKMNYDIPPKKLIEFLTLLLSIHPKYYIFHCKTADKFYEFYKYIDELFFFHNQTEVNTKDEFISFQHQTEKYNEVKSENEANDMFVFNIFKFKYKQYEGPIFLFDLSQFIRENLDEINDILINLDPNDEDYAVYYC